MTFTPAPKPPVSPPPAKPRRVKRVNKKRKASEFARCYHSKERVEWVKSMRCILRTPFCTGPSENAHTVGGGAGRKADYATIIPLCNAHHRDLHTLGIRSFVRTYMDGYNTLPALADAVEKLWLAVSFQSQPTLKKGRAT